MIYYLLIIFMTCVGAIASLFLKKASGSDGIFLMIKNINLYIGGFLYVLSALINIYVLKYMDYSIVLPMTSITYVWTMAISFFFLKEKITMQKIIGVLLVVAGAIVITL